jgi:hypothetical protein
MRWLARSLGALVLLALLALGAVWWRLDALAERMIERGATARLGVPTEVRGLLLRPLSGVLTLRGLRVANPPGFAGDFLTIDRARGELEVRTLRSEVVQLPRIVLTGVVLSLEETPHGGNYDAILANLARGTDDPAAAEGPSVRVHELLVRDVTAHVRLAPAAPPLTLQIPELRLAELGGAGGASAGQVTAQVVRGILVAVATEAPGVPLALAGRLLTGLGLSRAAELLHHAGERGLDAAREALRGIVE